MAQNELDLENFVKAQLGQDASINQVNSDGSVNVATPDGKVNKLDVNSLLKAQNIDPASTKIKYNSPESSLSTNDLGFTDQMSLILAKTPAQQKGLLEKKYGAENVVADQSGTFKVKGNDGLWKKADSAWYNELAASSPTIAASAVGTIKGAAAGAALGPWGAVAGGVLGGATAAALEQYGAQKFAEIAGIRTEQDMKTTADEVGRDFANNLLWDTATLGAGKVLKAVSPFNKMKVAEVLGSLVHGTKADDWLVAMRSGADAKAVRDIATADAKAAASGLMQSELRPSTIKTASILADTLETSKKIAERNYSTQLKKLDAAGALEFSHMPITSVRASLAEDLSKAGLANIDQTGKITFKSAEELASSAVKVVDETAQKRLKNVWNVVDSMYNKQEAGVAGNAAIKAKPELGELLKLKQYIGSVQDDLGHFMSAASVSDQPGRILSKSSSAVDKMFKTGASHITVDGVPGDVLFNKMNSDWSKFRTGYDVFAEKAKGLDIKNLGDSKSLQKMVSKLGSEDGSHILQAYKTIAESINSPTMMGKVTEFQQLNAGRNLASTAGGQGTMGAIKSAVGANALNIGTGVSNATQFTSGLNQLTGIAKGANFLRKLPPAHKEQLLLNNDAMSQFLQTITGLEPIRQSTESQLMSQVPQ